MRPLRAPSQLGAVLGALAVLLALLVLPALHPAHAYPAPGTEPALTSPGPASGDAVGECPLCRGLARVRSAPAGAGVDLRAAASLVLARALLEVTLPHAPAPSVSRARAPPVLF
jgi:hypothetical protein